MKVNTKVRYGLRAILQIADTYGGDPVPISAISQTQEISGKYLEQVVGTLRRADLIVSRKGVRGGYTLAREPKDISLWEIISALDNQTALVDCVVEPEVCDRSDDCLTRSIWTLLSAPHEGVLDQLHPGRPAGDHARGRGHPPAAAGPVRTAANSPGSCPNGPLRGPFFSATGVDGRAAPHHIGPDRGRPSAPHRHPAPARDADHGFHRQPAPQGRRPAQDHRAARSRGRAHAPGRRPHPRRGIRPDRPAGRPGRPSSRAPATAWASIRPASAIIDPRAPPSRADFVRALVAKRKHKGMTEPRRPPAPWTTPCSSAPCWCAEGAADGMVAGAVNATGNVLRAGFQIVGTAPARPSSPAAS